MYILCIHSLSQMFFINRGTVEVVSEDGSVVFATMNEGKFFGEISLVFSCPRTASIRYLINGGIRNCNCAAFLATFTGCWSTALLASCLPPSLSASLPFCLFCILLLLMLSVNRIQPYHELSAGETCTLATAVLVSS